VGLAGEIPERGFEGPVAPGVERDRLQHPNVALDLERVLPEEELGVALEAVHRVPRADAGEALVGVDVDEGGLERASRRRVPGGLEGRVEGQPQAPQTDARDPHERRKKGFSGWARKPSSSSIAGRPSTAAPSASRVAWRLPA